MSIVIPSVPAADIAEKAVGYLCRARSRSGGWGAVAGLEPTVEETAVAVEALALFQAKQLGDQPGVRDAIEQGVQWLLATTSGEQIFKPAPIGLYFARLWYSELAYPPVFTLSALQAAFRTVDSGPAKPESGDSCNSKW